MNKIPQLRILNSQIKDNLSARLLSVYKEQIEIIRISADKHAFFLDKAILTISSGAIGILLTIYTGINKQELSIYLQILFFITIILFGIAITAVLSSFYLVQKSLKQDQINVNKYYDEKNEAIQILNIDKPFSEQKEAMVKINNKRNLKNKWQVKTQLANHISSFSVWLAIITSILFILITFI